jgi:hypothetical protein
MTNSRPADTVFSGKGTDTVLAQDVYAIKESTNRNSVFESLKSAASDSASYIKNNPTSVNDLLRTAQDVKSGYVTKVDALSRISNSINPSALHKIKTVGGGLVDKIAGAVGIDPGLTGQIKTAVGDSIRYMGTSSPIESFNAFDIGRELLGDPDLMMFFDLEAEASLLMGLFDTASQYGMYDFFDFAKESNRYDEFAFTAAVMTSSTSVIMSGDIEGIKTVLKHISVEQFLGENPDAVKDILRNYRLPSSVTPDLYSGKLTELVEVLVMLNSRWYETTRRGEYVIDYDIMSTIGDDAKELFLMDDTLRNIVLTAPFYPANTAVNLATELYPLSAITTNR